jgi:hypothetical protein
MSRKIGFKDFAQHRDSTFRLVHTESYELKLSELADHSNAQLEQFSLVFTCSSLPWLSQGTYTLTHPDLAEISIFLVPIGPSAEGMRYESVFSRFVSAPGSGDGD